MASLTFRLQDKLREKITQDAKIAGLDMSTYIRSALENADSIGVLRGDGGIESDVVLRRSDIPKSLLSKLSRIAKGNQKPHKNNRKSHVKKSTFCSQAELMVAPRPMLRS